MATICASGGARAAPMLPMTSSGRRRRPARPPGGGRPGLRPRGHLHPAATEALGRHQQDTVSIHRHHDDIEGGRVRIVQPGTGPPVQDQAARSSTATSLLLVIAPNAGGRCPGAPIQAARANPTATVNGPFGGQPATGPAQVDATGAHRRAGGSEGDLRVSGRQLGDGAHERFRRAGPAGPPGGGSRAARATL